MSMYFIGIDISKYKHDCCIISAADQKVVSKVTIKNNKAGFNELLTIIHSLANPADIRIGFESTAHYAYAADCAESAQISGDDLGGEPFGSPPVI